MEQDLIQEEDALNNVLIECSNIEEAETCLQENTTQPEEMILEETRPTAVRSKRPREMNEEERWIMVGRNGKRVAQKVDLYISSSEKLPKQFELAKLLKSNNIMNVCRVKYINSYKVFIQFECADSAEQLINCKPLQDLGWRCQKPMEVVISYGVIKDVELDLSEKDMLDVISSTFDLIAVKRLKRRNKDSTGWEESESVRLGFRGPSLPAWVYIYGMKINVDPYVFPVTQCSRCWRFGHSLRVCPTKKVVCPKCGKGHINCEATVFKCINCTGNHISLDRSCPAFKKEKRLRDLMAEFNCSYRKAVQMYVPPDPPTTCVEQPPLTLNEPPCKLPESVPEPRHSQNVISYASVARTAPAPRFDKAQAHDPQAPSSSQPCPMDVSHPLQEKSKKKKKIKKKKLNEDEVFNWDISSESEAMMNDVVNDPESEIHLLNERKERREKYKSNLNFRQLISKLYALFSNSQEDLKSKIIQGVSLSIEWLVSTMGQYIWDLPFKSMFGL